MNARAPQERSRGSEDSPTETGRGEDLGALRPCWGVGVKGHSHLAELPQSFPIKLNTHLPSGQQFHSQTYMQEK